MVRKMNVPKLRFKEFNDEWIETNLGQSTTFKQGIQVDVENQFSEPFDDSVRFIRIVDYTQNTKDKRYIVKPKNANFVDEHDVVLVRYGATAGFVGHGITGAIANNMFTVTPNKKIDKDFLYTILKQEKIYKKLNSSNGSSAMPALNFGSVSLLKFKYPSISEQQKLYKFISLLDKKIELQTKKIEDLKLFKLYTENNLLNSNGSINWKETKLSDILIEGNKIPVKNTNEFKKITIKLNLNGLEFNETKREMSDTRPFYVRDENEIIIGKQNYFNGSIAIVTKEFAGCICSNAIMSFKVKEEFDLDYIYLYLSQKKYMKQREFLANGTGQKELSEREFLKFTIKIPDDSTIKRITSTINSINNKINLENNKLNNLMELKKGLMQNMFI